MRQGNEDSGYASDNLLIVADGMGGHVAGELASATVTAILAGLPIADSEDVLTQLADAVDEAQLEMRHIIAERPDFQGMGTTVTVVCWQGDRASIAHVGDSRATCCAMVNSCALTKDHTYVQTLVDAGQITEEEAHTHRRRNLLIRAIDGVNTVEPDLSIREVHAGDRILLCSDGLSGVVADAQIREMLSRGDPTGAVTALVEAAIERGAPGQRHLCGRRRRARRYPPIGNRPVVVGAAAEPRTRSQLPSVDFPQDSQLEPLAQPVEPAPVQVLAPAPASLGRRGHRRSAGPRPVRRRVVGLQPVLRRQRQRQRHGTGSRRTSGRFHCRVWWKPRRSPRCNCRSTPRNRHRHDRG